MRRARRLLRLVAAGFVALLLVAVVLLAATQTPWFKNWLRQLAVRQANQFLNGELSIGRLDGNLFSGVSLDRVAITIDGAEAVSIESIVVRYDIPELIEKGVSIARIEVRRPVVTFVRANGEWNLGHFVRRRDRPDDPNDKPRPLVFKRIEITDGTVALRGVAPASAVRVPHRFERLDAALALTYQRPGQWTFDLDRVAFQTAEPSIGVREVSGTVAFDDSRWALRHLALRTVDSAMSIDGTWERHVEHPNIDLAVVADRLVLAEIAPLVPKLKGIGLEPSFEVNVQGPANRLAIDMNVRSAAGHVSGSFTADLGEPRQSVAGEVYLEHFDLITIIHNPDAKTDVTGRVTFTVHGEPLTNTDSLRWAVTLNGPHAAALGYEADEVAVRAEIAGPRITFSGQGRGYGAEATGTGFVVLKGDTRPLSYDVRGVARHVDLRRLPERLRVPAAASDLNVTYQVSGFTTPGPGERKEVVASGLFEDSTVEGMRMAAGSTGGMTFRDGQFTYETSATVADLNLQRIGEGFDLGPLKRDRFASAINGRVVSTGRWTSVRDLSLDAEGTLASSTLPGAHISHLAFTAALAGDVLKWTARGHGDGVDLKTVLTPQSVAGTVTGSFDVAVAMAALSRGVSLDRLEATGIVELEPSTLGSVDIETATIDGDYRPSQATIRTLTASGPLASARAAGTLALDEEGASGLTFSINTPDLAEVSKLFDQSIGGRGSAEGTITGNRRELIVAGHLTANDVQYANAGALVLDADYTARIPDLRTADTSVAATAKATFLTVSGQNINELTAKVDYAHQRLAFDATATQPNRSLGAAGNITIAADGREVYVQRLTASTRGQVWELMPGAQPVVRFSGGVVTIDDLRLRSGEQLASAAGTFGRPGEQLRVTLDNIDVAAVEVILLRTPQLSGRLHASATVSGTSAEPVVKADVQVRAGAFHQFQYEDLSGTLTWAGKGITVDAKLQQNASAWLTAKGYVPVALFSGPGNAPEHEGSAAENRVDVKIESSPIDLGLIQGFTTALTDVSGVMQADVDITGSAADPRPGGWIEIRDAAFTVPAANVTYTGGSGKVEFKGDRVHIGDLRVLDNHKKVMQVSGDLAFNERELSGVDIMVTSKDFKVIDNKIGNVRISTDLHVVGELRYPRIEGELGISSGVLDLDELLAQTTDRAYSSRTASPGDTSTRLDGQPEGDVEPSFFDALQMQVHLTMPDDLIVKGADLRIADSPVGLGALNVTLGGDLWMSKTPWDRVRVTGTVNTVRGIYDFQGRRFAILRDGTARFNGIDERDPNIDIRAERVIQGVQTAVNLRGTLRHPEVTLTSAPPLDQADILALIVFNQPVNQIGAGQQINLVQRARSLALGAVAVQLANSIGSALDLDTFEIQIAPDSGAAAQVTVGQQVSPNLFLKVEQGVGDQSSTNVVVEYQINKYLLLQTNFRPASTNLQPFQRIQGTGTDLIFILSY